VTAPRRLVTFSEPDGNSPQFDEKAGIFRAARPRWHEAICDPHGHENRDAL
jgi:hypothetical protein